MLPIHFLSTTDQFLMRLLDAVHDAATERDLVSLSAAMKSLSSDHGSDEAQALIRSEVLPKLSMQSLLWMWNTITSPLQRFEMLEVLSNKTTYKLLCDGFVIGSDFSFETASDGNRHLILNSKVKHHLERTLAPGALVSLQLLTRHQHISR